jgi:hypothetical protein
MRSTRRRARSRRRTSGASRGRPRSTSRRNTRKRRAADALRLAGRDGTQHRGDPGQDDGRRRYRVEGRNGATGALVWSAATDYVTPPHNWLPPYNVLLTPQGRLYAPRAGGRLLVRADADAATGALSAQAFFRRRRVQRQSRGVRRQRVHQHPAYRRCPGQRVLRLPGDRANPAGLVSGIARVAPDGTGTWVGAAAAAATRRSRSLR